MVLKTNKKTNKKIVTILYLLKFKFIWLVKTVPILSLVTVSILIVVIIWKSKSLSFIMELLCNRKSSHRYIYPNKYFAENLYERDNMVQ